MHRTSSNRGIFLLLLLLVPLVAEALTLGELNEALRRERGRWTARPNALTAATAEERRQRLGENTVDDGVSFEVPETAKRALPRKFDWRDRDGVSYASPVLDQGGCGSCVIFATMGTLETQMNVSRGTPDSPWRYSPQHLLSCGGGNCKDGWNAEAAASFLVRYGVPDAACFPYTSGSTGQDLACRLTCADAPSRTTRIATYVRPTQSTLNVDAVKRAVLRGPVLTTMTVYEDFFYYGDGVYHHVTGNNVAGHAVSIVGWDDDDRAWIVRNSWGGNWGDSGFFRIAYNDVSGVGRSTWSLDVGRVDGFVTFGGEENPLVLSGKTQLPLRATFKDLVRLDWTVLRGAVPVMNGTAATSSEVAIDTSALPDGAYELRATAVRRSGSVLAQPRSAYVLNGKLEGSVALTGITAGQTLSGKVGFGVALELGPVPFTQVTLFAKNVATGNVFKRGSSSIAPRLLISWRTFTHPDGEYDVWLEAAVGSVASMKTEPIRVVLANTPSPG